MSEGLSAPRPRARKPLQGQPTLIPDSALVSRQDAGQPKKPKHSWEGTVPNVSPIDADEEAFIRVRGYPAPEGDPRGIIVRDSRGRERELDPVTKLSFERHTRAGTATPETTKEVNSQYGGGKPGAETLDRIGAENNSVKRR